MNVALEPTTEAEVVAAAAAIANARAGRRGAPAISNVLEVLQAIAGGKLYREVMEDARAALVAAAGVRSGQQDSNLRQPIDSTTSDSDKVPYDPGATRSSGGVRF